MPKTTNFQPVSTHDVILNPEGGLVSIMLQATGGYNIENLLTVVVYYQDITSGEWLLPPGGSCATYYSQFGPGGIGPGAWQIWPCGFTFMPPEGVTKFRWAVSGNGLVGNNWINWYILKVSNQSPLQRNESGLLQDRCGKRSLHMCSAHPQFDGSPKPTQVSRQIPWPWPH